MGEFTDKVKGHANELAGKAKRAVGDVTDNEELIAEGDAQEAKGDLENGVGAVKGAFNNKI